MPQRVKTAGEKIHITKGYGILTEAVWITDCGSVYRCGQARQSTGRLKYAEDPKQGPTLGSINKIIKMAHC